MYDYPIMLLSKKKQQRSPFVRLFVCLSVCSFVHSFDLFDTYSLKYGRANKGGNLRVAFLLKSFSTVATSLFNISAVVGRKIIFIEDMCNENQSMNP